ncbi:hypothetical protein K2173_012740 [Erythroxylum novogranatense]|uniref:Uncharacterized protein n=1 Tax=Erythroxylum novogranatense TaxID=1862640 RepID=A0AAV8TVQ1_9ROSI|nr:hypothetical protein K2173_012740 [Erythroxylum novogranatense]
MYGYRKVIRFLSFIACSRTSSWDPTVSLKLNHPSLMLLERSNTRDHFKQILGQIMRSNLIGQTFPMSRLILFSAISHPENLDMALILFNEFTPHPNLYIYNTMISALSYSAHQSFQMYNCLLRSAIYPDKQTLLHLLHACKHVSEAKQIHCHAIIMGLLHDYVQNSLIKIYLENELMRFANNILGQMLAPDAVAYNILVNSYAKKGSSMEALQLFHKMMALDLKPDEYTMLGLLVSCGQLGDVLLGKAVHAWIERRKLISSSNLILSNALLDMYVKCQELDVAQMIFGALMEKDVVSWNIVIGGCAKVGKMERAEAYFDQMPNRDLVSWNSLIAGYASKGDFEKVSKLFSHMVAENVMPNNITLVSFISGAAEVGALDQGRCAHGWLIRMQIKVDAVLGSALIDMYCKCGSIERALMAFQEVTEKDSRVWTTMISGFALHGYACSHSGLVDQGLRIFHCMKHCGIEPGIKHYGCLVDLLARSGRLTEAKDVIDRMPMKASPSIWGAMLNACRAEGDVEMAEIALNELLKLEPEEEGGYMLLSNIYAASGRWNYSGKIRGVMESRGVKKTAGCSSVVIDGVAHNFLCADRLHPREEEVKAILSFLKREMKLGTDFPLAMLP